MKKNGSNPPPIVQLQISYLKKWYSHLVKQLKDIAIFYYLLLSWKSDEQQKWSRKRFGISVQFLPLVFFMNLGDSFI